MLEISGYTLIEKLHKSQQTLVYRAIRQKDKVSVILKILASKYPTARDIARLHREYDIMQTLHIDEVAHAYGVERVNNTSMIVLEDVGGQTLKNIISSRKMDIKLFLEVAIQMTEIIGKIHKNSIIHKDLKPDNIIFNQKDNTIKIIDFSISSSFPKESKQKRSFNQIEGTLAYVSPEQTGWMNRLVDYRTDFYTLGITFYQMLTGAPPFKSSDPLELIHAHLAKQPEDLVTINPDVPQIVSDFVIKLLSKNAEDRYKTTGGMKFDLENCLKQLNKTGSIEKFVLGKKDISDRFQIPQKLYGREIDLKKIQDAYTRASKRTAEMVLISGEPGVGKSVLVQEMYKPVVQRNGFFISGKFEQYKKDIPYNAFIAAFEDLVNQVLTRNSDQIDIWKASILEILGNNAQVITNMVPKLELITGKQTDLIELTSVELQNRFHLIVQNFVSVFATQENPLVIFIDDLQWADSSSLKIIEILMTNPEFRHLLFIGAYREKEVSNNLILANTLKKIKEFRHNYSLYTGRKLPVENIRVEAIGVDAISELILDTLSCTKKEAGKLAELVLLQTAGNPFFVNHFLVAIHNDGLIWYEQTNNRWTWEIDKIKKKGFTDNVIQLMALSIEKASVETAEILQLASCIGIHFDLESLAILQKKDKAIVKAELAEAINEEFILLVEDDEVDTGNLYFQFQHDQILFTAYSMIENKRKREIHLKIGQLLIHNLAQKEDSMFSVTGLASIGDHASNENDFNKLAHWIETDIFAIVNHINIAFSEIVEKDENLGVIVLNLLAAKKARKSVAFESALDYFSIALKLLSKNFWKSHYFLSIQLYTEAAECEYVNANFARAEELCQVIIKQAHSVIDKVKVFEINIASLTPQNKFKEAIESGQNALIQLGIKIPKKPNQFSPLPDIVSAYLKMSRKMDRLIELPRMEDPEKLAAMNIMGELVAPSFISVPELFPVLSLKMVHLTLKYGLTNQSAFAFVSFGVILSSGLGNYEGGDKMANLALKTLNVIPTGTYDCKVLFAAGNMIRHWKHPLIEGQQILERGYKKGLESGDLLYASYCLNWYNAYNYLNRIYIPDTLEEMKKHTGTHEKIKQQDTLDFFNLWRQFVTILSENQKLSTKIKGEYFDEDTDAEIWIKTNNDTDLFIFYTMKGVLHFLEKQPQKAIDQFEKALPRSSGAFGMTITAEHNFFYSLALIALARDPLSNQRKKCIKKATTNQKQMKIWAANSPVNYSHKYKIVEAELTGFYGNIRAIVLYEKAIALALEHKFIFEQALANELLSGFYLSGNKTFIGNAYLRESYYLYYKWGAYAKVNELEEEFPELLTRKSITGSTEIIASPDITTKSNSQMIDLKSVLKVSQNLSSEMDLSRLSERLISITIESAGAERGYLILNRDEELMIEAEGDHGKVKVIESLPVEKCKKLSLGVVNYVNQTKESVVINDTAVENQFQSDPYIIKAKPKSILCLPVVKVNKLLGILYLENNLLANVFTKERLDILNLLTTQAIISLENAMYVNKIKTINTALEDEIVQHKHTEADLVQTKERYALAARGANDGLWDWDIINDKIYYSPRWKLMLGYKENEIKDFPNEWFSRVHEDDIGMLRSSIDSHLEGILPHLECEYRMKHKDGRYLWMVTRGLAVRDSHDVPYRMAGSQTEITKRKLAEDQLRHDAMHDMLTGLPNWNLLLDRMNHAIKRKQKEPDFLFATLFIDVDRFKVINDSLGHEIGNHLLIELSVKLEACIDSEDTVARLGGDEFGILLESINDVNEAVQIIEKIREVLKDPFEIKEHELFITISIGMVVGVADYNKSEDIIRDADTAMHRAKSQGRNRYELFDQTMHANIIRYMNTESELRKALERDEFMVYYQPIVSLENGKILGVEALLRWNHPGREISSPLEFIPVAEDSGLIIPIGEWVLFEACRQVKKWETMGLPPIEVAVNLSGRQFGQKNLLGMVDKALEETGLNPHMLQFELTESVLMDDTSHTIEILEQLKSRGIITAIDDFGTGYSSLNYLKQFPVQKLKIDRSFVQNMVTNPNDAALIKAIIAMGETMKMRVIAEGVEKLEQLLFLKSIDCHEVQGYYFSKPLSADNFTKLYEKKQFFPLD
ncbi:MAG: EAL domain-containing protein [Leptospirales bacterium]